jgi:ubiquinone/menaquinone biosynthesis C-methylase UbiE
MISWRGLMKVFKRNASSAMRQDWNTRARKDAFYYVATWRQDWTVETFLESGEEEYIKLVQPALDELQFVPEDSSMLEVGCGAGRMTASFARRFASVYALDISEEMQNLAKQHLARFSNIHWMLGDGTNLSAIPSESVDFVFSYLVLQHLPAEGLAMSYVREMLRVLRQRGAFLFQFNGAKQPNMNWKGRLVWGAVDTLWALNLKQMSRAAARQLSFDPETVGKNWRGARLDADKVVQAVRASGGSSVLITGEGSPMTWCRGLKLQRAT